MAGVGYNPTPFQKKSSLFVVFSVNPWQVCLPAYFLGNQRGNNTMLLPEAND